MTLTPKRERFAQEVASGKTQADAYRVAFSCNKSKPETVQANASRLMSDSMVAARVAELKQELSEKALWSREDSTRELIKIVNDGECRPNDKTGAIKVLNEMHGYNAPKKVEVSGAMTLLLSNDDANL